MENQGFIYANIRKLPEDAEKTRTVEFVISDESKDRHGTVLLANGWKLDNYRRNPIVGYQHNVYGDMCAPPNPDDIIGKSEVYQEGSELVARVTFEPADLNPLAEKVFRKILFGTLSMASVGFVPLRGWRQEKDAKGNIIAEYSDEHELYEWSVVNIPSNPNAAKRELKVQTDRAMRYVYNMIGGKLSMDELRKMTVDGLINLISGDGVNNDKEERETTDALELEKAKQELRKQQEQEQLKLKLRLMSNKINKEDK